MNARFSPISLATPLPIIDFFMSSKRAFQSVNGPDCPCCANGIGCWWEGWLGEDGATEGWGCGCGEACRSAVRGHVYHEGEGSRQRRAVLASLNRCFEVSGEGEAANAPKAPVPDEATRVEGVPSDPPSGS